MKIALYVNIGGLHGMGHAVRMRALGWALSARGANVFFVTETFDLLAPFVRPFPTRRPEDEAHLACDLCVIDMKAPGLSPPFCPQIVRIDDPSATPETCTLLIAPVLHWDSGDVARLSAAFGPRFLYGAPYVMLRRKITDLPVIPYGTRQDGPIVFCAGGSDSSGALGKMASWMQPCRLTTSYIFAVGECAGPLPWPEEPDVTPTQHLPFVPSLLQHAGLVVSTFGVTCYEALYFQTPTLMLSHTDENDWGAYELSYGTNGAIERLGPLAAQTASTFQVALRRAWGDRGHRFEMAERCSGVVDGEGLARVAEAILALGG